MAFACEKSSSIVAIHWFRKGLRLHDNPALFEACETATKVYPVFVMDPWFANKDKIGVNRYSFLLESLRDLDSSLRDRGSRLIVVRGKPELEIPNLVQKWGVNLLTFESDTSPFSKARDDSIASTLRQNNVRISTHSSHTLHAPEEYLQRCRGAVPSSYQSFVKLFESMKLREEIEGVFSIPPLSADILQDNNYDVPALEEMGYGTEKPTTSFHGGEREALERLDRYVIDRPTWTIRFEKPQTSPNSLEPSTTVLSPYLKFGCLSALKFYNTLARIYASDPKHSRPPVSLHGQLLWREFFYFASATTPNFNKMEGNPKCRQIPWDRNNEKIEAWKLGRTGHPFIDAIMTQLRVEGWIHHLARHAVACYLTRGDLWQHWEEGVKVFDLYLLDADWALNNANWQWLSCSNFFYQYFRVYSPIAFGKKTDPDGNYIRKWLPQLRNYPTKYIYEPWKAPKDIQRQSGCIIGLDYPNPIVSHEVVSKENMDKMKLAYELNGEDKEADPSTTKNKKRDLEVSSPQQQRKKSSTSSSSGGNAKLPWAKKTD